MAKVIAALTLIWMAICCLAATSPTSGTPLPAKNCAKFSDLGNYQQTFDAKNLANHARKYGFILKDEAVALDYHSLCCGGSLLMAKIYLATGSIEKAANAFTGGAPFEAAQLQMWYSTMRSRGATPKRAYCDLLVRFFETFAAKRPTAEAMKVFFKADGDQIDDMAKLLLSASALYLLEGHQLDLGYPAWVAERLKKHFELPPTLYATLREVVDQKNSANTREWDAIRATASLIELHVEKPLYQNASPQEILESIPSWEVGVYFIGIPADAYGLSPDGHACTLIKTATSSYFFDINEGTKNTQDAVKEAFAAYYGSAPSRFESLLNRLVGRVDFDGTKKAAFEIYKLSEMKPEADPLAHSRYSSFKQHRRPLHDSNDPF